ncbi:MAG: hypothetical protein H6549_00830 [Chitinophagales bacterium]|nr:hypothetical protein [Chitinophagales bacterium]
MAKAIMDVPDLNKEAILNVTMNTCNFRCGIRSTQKMYLLGIWKQNGGR